MTDSNFTIESILLAHRFDSPPHWVSTEYVRMRPLHGLVYVLEGSAVYEFAKGERLMVHKDDLLFLPAGTPYITRCGDEHFIHMTINFSIRGDIELPRVQNFVGNTRIKHEMSKLVKEWSRRMPHYFQRCIGLLYLFLCLLMDSTENGSKRPDSKLNSTIHHIHDKYMQDISISDLAKSLDMSEVYFRKLFSKKYGCSPLQYLTRLRIGHACELLRGTDLSIENICFECGYHDPGYFCRIFKKTIGATPTEYRSSD